MFNVPCLPCFLQKPLLSVVSYNKGRTKFLDVNWRKKSCLQFLSIAPLPRQAGLQPEASRQNLTATLQNVSSSYQCVHNSQPSRYGVIFQYYPTVIYNICLVPHSTDCVKLWSDYIIHIYNSTMKAIISNPVSLFIWVLLQSFLQ